MKLTRKEKWLRSKLKLKCAIYPAFGYPTIQGVTFNDTIELGNNPKGVIVKNCRVIHENVEHDVTFFADKMGNRTSTKKPEILPC